MQEPLKSINDIDFDALSRNRTYHESPTDWEDQALYFLIVDRFSNGLETDEMIFDPHTDTDSILTHNKAEEWNYAGSEWNGGNLNGVMSKLDYLKNMGITTLWLSPIFKQTTMGHSYHGYGIQDFLNVDPHFWVA